MANEHLATYLNDHLAGSAVTLELLDQLEATHSDGTLGEMDNFGIVFKFGQNAKFSAPGAGRERGRLLDWGGRGRHSSPCSNIWARALRSTLPLVFVGRASRI